MTTIDKETSNKVSFMTFIITKFARAYKMNSQQAYLYLNYFHALDEVSRFIDNTVNAIDKQSIISTCAYPYIFSDPF